MTLDPKKDLKNLKNLIERVDACLPQTQCGLCGYNGCKPYAKAIVEANAPLNRCPPGGVETLQQLGAVLGQNIEPWLESVASAQKPAQTAQIREAECIGCTKCIQVCPTDAILGASKQMHSVIASACTGCELCVPVCPTDCIDLLALPSFTVEKKTQRAATFRDRFEARTARLAHTQEESIRTHQEQKLQNRSNQQETMTARQEAIQAALTRVREKSSNRSRSHHEIDVH